MTQNAAWASTPVPAPTIQQLRKERGWRLWIAPRPFTLISLIFLVFFPLALVSGYGFDVGGSRGAALIIGALLALLALDRVDYWLYGDVPPTRAGIVLLAVRFLLIEAVAQYTGTGVAIGLYAMLPSVGAVYFGPRGAYLTGALIWIALAARATLDQMPLDWGDRDVVGGYVSGLVTLSFGVVFVVTMARIAWEERASRIRVESLLARLQRSHDRLKEYSEHSIAATEDRNRIAGEIHNTLGHYLAVIGVQLEKALAFRERDPQAAEQAVRDGKQLAREALHDVRRSVGALRSHPSTIQSLEEVEGHSREQKPESGKPRSGLRMWLAPRPFDLASATIYIGVLVMDLGWGDGSSTTDFITWRALQWGGIVLSLIVLDRIDYLLFGEVPPVRAGILFLALRALLIVALGVTVGWWYTIWLFPLLIYTGFAYFGSRGGYPVTALTSAWLLVMAIQGSQGLGRIDMETLFGGLALLSFIVLLVTATARTALKERMSRVHSEELIARLEVQRQRLAAYSEQTLATIEERNHLAREIHDGLGHYLTVINVQLEKALAFRSIDPGVADQAIRDARRLTSEALRDVRVTMGSLKPKHETFSLRPAVEQLVANFAQNIGFDVSIEGNEDGFSRQSLIALYRAAQEGLTNIQKHSMAQGARIRIHLGESEARLYLNDDGRGFDPDTLHGAGDTHDERYGLQGVRERLQLIGGSMEIFSKAGAGTSLHITVPKDPLVFAHAQKHPISVPAPLPAGRA